MSVLKRITTILIVCLIITITIPTDLFNPMLTVEAHSGRTDMFGGHHDYKNKSGLGYYHYHHGYPAHLHKDGVCPYGGINNSSSSSSTTKSNTGSVSTTNSDAVLNNVNTNTQAVSSTNNTATSEVKISDTSYDNVAFNALYYASHHADVYEAYGDDAKALYNHFINNGIIEGRQSSEQFSIFIYRDNNQDLIDTFGDDLIKYYNHFIEYGYNENRVSK